MYKRIFDFAVSLVALFFLGGFIALFWVLASVSTLQNGMFTQIRIGRYGHPFVIYKLRSMVNIEGQKKVTSLGRFMRKYKIDELPQLYNILVGDMSFVGPRPDVPGYYDKLLGEDRELLQLRPGLTGPASLKYANEESILQAAEDPVFLNDYVIFPDKIKINREYLHQQNFWTDLKIIAQTFFRKKTLQ